MGLRASSFRILSRESCEAALLYGRPGTGKNTIVNGILGVFRQTLTQAEPAGDGIRTATNFLEFSETSGRDFQADAHLRAPPPPPPPGFGGRVAMRRARESSNETDSSDYSSDSENSVDSPNDRSEKKQELHDSIALNQEDGSEQYIKFKASQMGEVQLHKLQHRFTNGITVLNDMMCDPRNGHDVDMLRNLQIVFDDNTPNSYKPGKTVAHLLATTNQLEKMEKNISVSGPVLSRFKKKYNVNLVKVWPTLSQTIPIALRGYREKIEKDKDQLTIYDQGSCSSP